MADASSERLERLRKLVHAALHDTSTFEDDGPFGDIRESPWSTRHAWNVRSLLAGRPLTREEAELLATALREGADETRTVVLLQECRGVLPNDERWRAVWSGLVDDPSPRVRLLTLAADFLLFRHFLTDPDEEVRLAALRVLAQHLTHARPEELVRARLADLSPRVRRAAASLAFVLPDWRDALARLAQDPDASVRDAVPAAEAFALESEAATARQRTAREADERARREKRARQQAAQRKDRGPR